MISWRYIDTGPCTASFNMAADEAIAGSVRAGKQPPTLRLYGWERPSVSLGQFQRTADIDLQYCINNGIPLVRRPTGGRAILHNNELTYSFSSRNEGLFSCSLLDTYRQLSHAFKRAFEKTGLQVEIKNEHETGRNLVRSPLCFKTTSYGEIVFQGRKLIGSAQRRWINGFLQQGSIPYTIDDNLMEKVFRTRPDDEQAGRLIGLGAIAHEPETEGFKEAVRWAFEETFNMALIHSVLSPEELLLARELETRKYLSHAWNFQR